MWSVYILEARHNLARPHITARPRPPWHIHLSCHVPLSRHIPCHATSPIHCDLEPSDRSWELGGTEARQASAVISAEKYATTWKFYLKKPEARQASLEG